MALRYEVHPRYEWSVIDLYDNPEGKDESGAKMVRMGVLKFKTRKIADEVAAVLNDALIKGHVEATERLGL